MGAINPYWNPGFPLATVLMFLVSGSWEKAELLVSIVSASLVIWVMFWYFKKYSLLLALLTAFLMAFYSGLQKLVLGAGITEPLYILFLWLSILSGWEALRVRKLRYFIITGLLFGATYLIRTDVIGIFVIYIGIAFLYLFFAVLKTGFFKSLRVSFCNLGILGLAFLAINSPYIIINSIHLGKPTLSGKYAYINTGNPYTIEKNRPTLFIQDIFSVDYPDYASSYYNPDRAYKSIVLNFKNGSWWYFTKKGLMECLQLYHSVNTDNFFVGFGLPLTIFGLISGLVITKFRAFNLYLLALFLAGLFWTATFMAAIYRYLVFAYPIFIYLESLGLFLLAKAAYKLILWFPPLKHLKVIKPVAGVVMGLMILTTTYIYFNDNGGFQMFQSPGVVSRFRNYKLIGDWIKENNIKVISAHFEALGYYGDAKTVYMPSEKPDKIVAYLKKWGVEYLFIREDDVDPYFQEIADVKYKNPNLQLVKIFSDGTLVWKIKLTDQEKLSNQRTNNERRI